MKSTRRIQFFSHKALLIIFLFSISFLVAFYAQKNVFLPSSSLLTPQRKNSSFILTPTSYSSRLSFDIQPRIDARCPELATFLPPPFLSSLALPQGRVRIGFNILFHQNVPQLLRLLNSLRPSFPYPSSSSSDSPFAHFFVINVDPRVSKTDFNEIKDKVEKMSGSFHLTRWKMCYAAIESLLADLKNTQYLLSLSPPVDFVINLSGTDYPVRPLEELHEFLSYHKGTSFVHSHKPTSPNRWRNKVVKNCGTVIDTNDANEEPSFVICQGYHWHIMARDLALFATQSSFSRDVLNFLHEVFIPEEFFFATMAAHCPCEYKQFPMRYYTWDDWCRPNSLSPCMMQTSMFHFINQTGFFFARKFDVKNENSLKLMDMFDKENQRRSQQTTNYIS